MKIFNAIAAFAFMMGTAVWADEAKTAAAPKTVEELAIIGPGEIARLDKTTILSRGHETRFDVNVAWRDPAQRPEAAAATRVVRYVANCKDTTLALAMVVTSDQNGRTLKRYLVPPGGADYAVPQAGSQEAGWMAQACKQG